MKKILLSIFVIFLLPSLSLASFAVPWAATSTTQSWIFPVRVNGTEQTVVGTNFNATTTTATSTFAGGALISTGGGNVGIGTSTPGSKLEVNGNLRLTTNSNQLIFATTNDVALQGSLNDLYLISGGLNAEFGIYARSTPASGRQYGFDAATAGNLAFVVQGNNNLFNILAAGNAGVGSTTPWGRLSVSATSSLSNLPLFVISSSTASATTTAFIVDAQGRLGVGTSTPTRTLEIGGQSLFGQDASFYRGLTSYENLRFVSQAGLTAPTAAFGSAGGSLTNGQAYKWVWTMLFPEGESGPSPVSNTVTPGSGFQQANVTIKNDPTGRAIGKKIYRTLGNGAVFFLSTTINDNTTTVFLDSAADGTISSNANPPASDQSGLGIYINGARILAFGNDGRLGLYAGTTTTGLFSISATSTSAKSNFDLFSVSTSTANATTTAFVINKNGLTGVGTSTPGADFAVQGNALVSSNLTVGNNTTVIGNATVNSKLMVATTTSPFPADIKGALLLEPVSAPGTTYSGLFWNSSTKNQLTCFNGNVLYLCRSLYVATGDATINSATPTSGLSGTKVGTTLIAAGTLTIGQRFTIWGSGYYSTPLGNTDTVTITTSIASSTATTISTVTTAAFPGSATNLPFDFNLQCSVRSIGTAATMVCDGEFKYATALSGVAKTSNSLSTVGTITFDSTVNETLDVKSNWSVAAGGQSAVVQQSWIDF